MTFLNLAQERYSVRKFSAREVEQEKIDQILRAGQIAPTACNNQPQKILVIQSAEALEKLQKCKTSHFGETLAVLTCYDRTLCWKREYDDKSSGDIDASIITTHMMLAAQELGIGSTWVMHFIPEAIKEEFMLPDNYEPVSLLVMGYPAEDAKPFPGHTSVRPIAETVQYNSFS